MSKVRIIKAPESYHTDGCPSIFLGGGMTDWRHEIMQRLSDFDGVLIDPQLAHWPKDQSAASDQVMWEHRYRREATWGLFWFPAETTCSVTWLELGYALAGDQTVVVGADPNYSRRDELRLHCSLARPELCVVNSLDELAFEVLALNHTRETL